MEIACQYSKNKFGESGVDSWEKFENSSWGGRVLHVTSYSIIPCRCLDENGKGIYQNVKRACRAIRSVVFPNETYSFVAFS